MLLDYVAPRIDAVYLSSRRRLNVEDVRFTANAPKMERYTSTAELAEAVEAWQAEAFVRS